MTTDIVPPTNEFTTSRFRNWWIIAHVIMGIVAQLLVLFLVLPLVGLLPLPDSESSAQFLYTVKGDFIIIVGSFSVLGIMIGICQQIMIQKRLKRWLVFTVLGALLSAIVLWLGSYLVYRYQVNMAGDVYKYAVSESQREYKIYVAINNFLYDRGISLPLSADFVQYVIKVSGTAFMWGMAIGVGIGLAQYLKLRRYVKRASQWWVANIGAGIISQFLMVYISYSYTTTVLPQIIGNILNGLIYGVVFGGITGFTWAGLWRRSNPV
jgi:hypothetical protein